jgi:cytochrome b6-f complex subunit 5
MVEPFLFGIIMGLMSITLLGLFVAAYIQYGRGEDIEFLI